MSRYRPQQTPGDNLRELYAKIQQLTSAGLGDSSIDWDDSGDDGASLDVTVSDSTVAKYGHDGSLHGFLVPNGGGWQTVQSDAQARADTAEADAKAYTDTKNAAMDGRMDTAESDISGLLTDMFAANNDIIQIKQRLNAIEDYITAHPAPGYTPPWA